ncbi:hypothetical protein ACQP0C_17700 [Nocardia sp. CA-129566]|uniref:hypothetical protein n=1 Tax=Nocardia sp. CA-129566 TaxID=3239976 RepID=UPI003D99EF92
MQRLHLGDGRTIRLGAQLAKAGEGTISDIAGHPEWVAKIFHPHLTALAAKRTKVQAMAKARPPDAVQPDGFVVLTWPDQTIVESGTICGFVMGKVDMSTAVEVHKLSNPADRQYPNPTGPQWPKQVTWTHLVNIATNLCLAVDTAHRAGAVIGDFNERNILVCNTTRVTLVDCDSFQFRSGNTTFLCDVARPEFLAPELAGVDLKRHAREKNSDLFVLAIHIYLLLMAGNHPFLRGDWTGPGDKPEALVLAAGGQWAGGPNSQLKAHPAAPPMTMLPRTVQALFERALGTGAKNPTTRPSAAQWQRALAAITTVHCARDKTHVYPYHNKVCPWCRLSERHSRPVGATGRTVRGGATTSRIPVTTSVRKPGVVAPTMTAPVIRPAPPIIAPSRSARQAGAIQRHRAIDGTVAGVAIFSALTVVVPWLIGHFLLRGRYLQTSSLVYDDQIRAIWPYFWTELRGGWALIALISGALLALRPWQGRRPAVVGGVVLLCVAVWLGTGARAGFGDAESDSVRKLASTTFPFDSRFLSCGRGLTLGFQSTKSGPVESMWQLYLGSELGYRGNGCNRISVYRGWQRVGYLTLPAGVEFEYGSDDLWTYVEESKQSLESGYTIWGYEPSQVWLNARTSDGRIVSTNLRDAASQGLAIR